MESPRRLHQIGPTGKVQRPEFVVVHRDHHSYPGVLFEWRLKRESDGFTRRSARVVYMDGDEILRQGWFHEHHVEPAPHTAAPRSRMTG